MRETVTISIPKDLKTKLDKQVKKEHLNRSDIVRDALRKYFSIVEFRELRRKIIPYAEKQGLFTDEDIFNKVS